MILIITLFDRTATIWFHDKSEKAIIEGKSFLVGLDRFLKQTKKQWKDIDGAIFILGESSFSVTRQIVTILNTLIFMSHLKVVVVPGKAGQEEIAIKRGLQLLKRKAATNNTMIKPLYSRPPNITKA